jgi:hypothetical protein
LIAMHFPNRKEHFIARKEPPLDEDGGDEE